MAARPGFLRHEGGKLDIEARIEVRTLQDTRDIYTPGVARVPQAIADDSAQLARYTMVGRTVAICTTRSDFQRFDSRGTRGCRRSALTQREPGFHSPVGQRHLDAPRAGSAPAKVHVPWSHSGGRWSPRLTPTVSRSGMIGRESRFSHSP